MQGFLQVLGTPESKRVKLESSGECGDDGEVSTVQAYSHKLDCTNQENRKAFVSVGVLYYRLSLFLKAGGPVNSSGVHLACLCSSSPQNLRGR